MNFTSEQQTHFIRLAMEQVELSIQSGDGPFGIVLVDHDGQVIASAHNTQNTDLDTSAHAEINLLRHVGKQLGQRKLAGYAAFTNASSCSMCSSALIKAGIRDFYYGAAPEGHMTPALSLEQVAEYCQDPINIHGGILAEECAAQVAQGRKAQRP
jgi:tRNA(adenine34) deaminase